MPKYTWQSYLASLALTLAITVGGAVLQTWRSGGPVDWGEILYLAGSVFIGTLVKLRESWDGSERRQ